ncbi:uncharacterized protein DC041_0012628 [Schistosoma bovis]|uniref:Uncharacterized protein n=1 Tax=Schistosoma bovis TaxID=6184 RepID=A0A430QKY0_SCHBO|nr:uncharacterized protein DC041_0012628 [Schistosoma bovis]
MDFREVLALAKKKQSKHDDEVKRIEEQAKQRELEKKRQMEIANKLNRKFTKPNLITNNNVKVQNHSNASTSLSSTTTVKTSTVRSKTSGPDTNTVCKPEKSTVYKDAKDENGRAANKSSQNTVLSCPTKSNSKKNGEMQSKPNRLSFAEMMELAKKNVHQTSDRKRPFDDLIPCAVDSKYRKLDSNFTDSSKPASTTSRDVTKTKSQLASNLSESLKASQEVELPKLSHSVDSNGFRKTGHKSVMEKVVQHLEKSHRVPYDLQQKNNNSSQRTTCVSHSVTLQEINAKSSKPPKTSKVHLHKESRPPPKNPINSKLVSINMSNKKKSVVSQPPKTSVSQDFGNVKLPLSKSIPTSNKDGIKNLNKNSNSIKQKSKEYPQSKNVDNRTQGRGIAAQLGVSFQSQNSANMSVSDSAEEDEYMSDDSFIDDSEALQSKEYARVVRDIHRALKFDPRKYKDVNPYEDLRCMEAKYCDIEKEERRSARLAALEDNEELIRDMMRRKEKMAKKRQQFLGDDND